MTFLQHQFQKHVKALQISVRWILYSKISGLKLNHLKFKNQKLTLVTLSNKQISYTQSCQNYCQYATSSSITTTCCSTNNCNSVSLVPSVSSCWVGGLLMSNSSLLTKQACVSPKNQFCLIARVIKRKHFNLALKIFFKWFWYFLSQLTQQILTVTDFVVMLVNRVKMGLRIHVASQTCAMVVLKN